MTPKPLVLGLLGGVVGGVVGYFAFFWIAGQGFYALVLPGGLVGLGAGLAARTRSVPLAVVCALAALVLGFFCDWRFAPFKSDPSFVYYLTHLGSLDSRNLKIALVVIGAAVAYALALGFGRRR
jgi:hypothetical protein